MSKIEELIAQYCPKGVERKTLGEISTIETGKLNANAAVDDGTYHFFTCAKEVGRIDKYRWDTEALLIAGNGYLGLVHYYKGKFDAYQRTYVLTQFSPLVSAKYLYYVLSDGFGDWANAHTKQGSVPYIVLNTVSGYQVPLPPLEVQNEIVRVLDSFTELEAELEAELEKELEARKRQYEQYRSELLTFGPDTIWSTLGDISSRISSGGTPRAGSKEFYDNGTIPWLRTNEVKFHEIWNTEVLITEDAVKKTSAKWIPENCVIVAISGATAGRSAINKIPMTTNQHCCNLQINPNKANYRFVFYWVAANYETIKAMGRGARADLNSALIKGFNIPIPPLPEQERIVSILDKFDALVNDISIGLPAEIEARRKQYAYYREKLLTFKEYAKD